MQKTTTDPDGFLESLPDKVRPDMTTLDHEISAVMAGHPREMWEGTFWGGTDQRIIGYGDYTYTRSDKQRVDWFIVGLAMQKISIGVYLNAVENGKYVAETYGPALGKVKVGKSTISFKRLDDVDLDGLLELVARSRDLMTDNEDPN